VIELFNNISKTFYGEFIESTYYKDQFNKILISAMIPIIRSADAEPMGRKELLSAGSPFFFKPLILHRCSAIANANTNIPTPTSKIPNILGLAESCSIFSLFSRY